MKYSIQRIPEMSSKNISTFLPKHLRNDDVRGFIDSTTQTLFDKDSSEYISEYVGHKVGGMFDHRSDAYTQEMTKIRQDYQLEPSLVRRDEEGSTENMVFFNDVINTLRNGSVSNSDFERMLGSTSYTYTPPINYDMFANYGNYFWLPEGVPAIDIVGLPEHIVGNKNFNGLIRDTTDTYPLSDGNHIVLDDGKEYIVTGVGDYIKLIEFDLESNKPNRVSLRRGASSDSLITLFPKEYITIERGSIEGSPWTRNNAWYHVDAVYPMVPTVTEIDINISERRAMRPIIQYNRNLSLFNYVRGQGVQVDVRFTDEDLPETSNATIDGVVVFDGMTLITNDKPIIFTAKVVDEDLIWEESHTDVTDKVIITDGITYRGEEVVWRDDEWFTLQRKRSDTQEILFDIFTKIGDEAVSISRLPESEFSGVSIFGYRTGSSAATYDRELGMSVVMHTDQRSSEFVFESSLTDYFLRNRHFVENNTTGLFYRVNSDISPAQERTILLSIGKNSAGNPELLINGERKHIFTVYKDQMYTFDASDSSTRGGNDWGAMTPITIIDENANALVPTIISGTSRETYDIVFDKKGTYFCRAVVGDNLVYCEFEVVDYNKDFYLESEYIPLKNNLNVIQETKCVNATDDDVIIDLNYTPTIDRDVSVTVSGDQVRYNRTLKRITIPSHSIKDGSYIEVNYTTHERIKENNPSNVRQMIPRCISNNPFNEMPRTFRYDELFSHITSVIAKQNGFIGSSQGNNNFRDLSKDLSTGGTILRNEISPVPMLFSLSDKDMRLQKSIETSRKFYQSFKNQIVLETESVIRDEITVSNNSHAIFDRVVRRINATKLPQTSPFANTNMFAYGDGYVDISIQSNGVITTRFDLTENDALYITSNEGKTIMLDEDYSLHKNEEGLYVITLHTLSFNNIATARLYPDMVPSFCPATPQKLGLLPTHKPRFFIDETFEHPTLFVIGHDGSKARAHTNISSYYEGEIDMRDLVLLEFETRVYNGIGNTFRHIDRPLIEPSITNSRIGFEGLYDENEKESILAELFFKWSNDNNLDYHENNTYVPNNPWMYNYSKSTSFDGVPLKGHWRGIYHDYFGTDTPHKTPWEMLGFIIMPHWWEEIYGADYNINNHDMWDDICQGIIRDGDFKNFHSLEYLNNNPYRRMNLRHKIPVDEEGNLIDPIRAGIVVETKEATLSERWKVGDCSPVEQAWMRSSDYQYDMILLSYALKPFELCSKGWDTTRTYEGHIWEKSQTSTHSDDNSLPGIGVWISDNLKNENKDMLHTFVRGFKLLDINLGYKMGGYVNNKEIRVMADTSNSPSLAPDDFDVIVHKGTDFMDKRYSGVIVERVEANTPKRPFVEGLIYKKDDIIYSEVDRSFYRKLFNNDINEWTENEQYNVNNDVEYNGRYYTCINAHTSSSDISPEDSGFWSPRKFLEFEWVILINPPSSGRTAFKVYGYDISRPYFNVLPSLRSNTSSKITAYGKGAVPVRTDEWVRFTDYKEGHIVRHSEYVYECITSHTSGMNFDSNYWTQLQEVPLTNRIDVRYYTQGSTVSEKIEYHTTFDTIEEVVELLVSYGRFLTEHEGFIFDQYDSNRKMNIDWVYSATEFVEWAVNNTHKGATIALSPVNNTIKIKNNHGVISLFGSQNSSIYDLLTYNGNPIPTDRVTITRDNKNYRMTSSDPIFYAKLGVHEYEHAIRINNRTMFGDTIFDTVLGTRIGRIFIRGSKTTTWNGRLYAPGYIIGEDGIKPNFDTAVKDITNFNDLTTMSPRGVINDLKFHNVGYQTREYLENLGLDSKSQIDFYSGFIRQKGSLSSYKKISRSNTVSARDTIDVIEEWAFKESLFGGSSNYSQIELQLKADEFVRNPQYIRMIYNGMGASTTYGEINIDIKNPDEWLTKPNRTLDSGEMFKKTVPSFKYKDAGYVLYHEHDLKSSNFTNLKIRMEELMIPYTIGTTAWLSNDRMSGDTWGVFLLDKTQTIINSVIDGGTEGVNGALVRASNMHVEMPYSIIDSSGKRRNVMFYHIREDIYITLDDDENEYVLLSENSVAEDLGLLQWKPLRISANPLTRFIDTIDSHINRYSIVPFEGMLLYKDEEIYGVGNYEVYKFIGGEWISIRSEEESIDSSLIKEIAMYDEDDKLIDYLSVYDPLQGFIPGGRTDLIDYIGTEDPVTYERISNRDYSYVKDMAGKLWWDTNSLVYYNYHIGDSDYKKNVWGTIFPDSEVVIYEWVRSIDKPEDYDGEVKSIDDYIEFSEYNYSLGEYSTYYYFWVKNPNEIKSNVARGMSANQIANTISNPSNNGFAMASVVDNYNIVVMDEAQTMMVNDCKLKIYYQLKETESLPHTNWILLPEDHRYNDIPDFLFDRLLDSIVGYDNNGNRIPFSDLSPTSRYGNDIGQTWFVNRDGAIEIFTEMLNTHLARINISELDISSDSQVDVFDNLLVDVGDWYVSGFDKERQISKVVRDVSRIRDMNPVNGEYVKVITSEESLEDWEIYQWNSNNNDIVLVAKSNSVLRLKEGVFSKDYEDSELFSIRNTLDFILGGSVTTREYEDIFNNLFFAMVRYVYMEQPNNDWVFPTTYVTVLEDNVPLEQVETYQPNAIADISDYLREVKPYHTKIRNYDRIYKIDSDGADMSLRVTDFDNPVFFTQNEELGFMQNKLIERFEPNGRDYPLTFNHSNDIIVMDDGKYVEPHRYTIEGGYLKLNYTPKEGRNHVKSIVIDSRDLDVQERIEQWIRSWGYGKYLRDTYDFETWERLAINKDIVTIYNDKSILPQNSLESLASLVEKNIHYTAIEDSLQYNEKDRFVIHNDPENFMNIVFDSFIYVHDEDTETSDILYDGGKVGQILIINGIPVLDAAWWLSGEYLHVEQTIKKGDIVEVRPHRQYTDYLIDLDIKSNKFKNHAVLVPGFDSDFNGSVLMNGGKNITTRGIDQDSYRSLTTINISFDYEGDDIEVVSVNQGKFTDVNNGQGSERSAMKIHENINITYVNRRPVLFEIDQLDEVPNRNFQESIEIKTKNGVREYEVDLSTNWYYTVVILDGNTLVPNAMYTFTEKGISLKSNPGEGKILEIRDVNAGSLSSQHVNKPVLTKKAGGGCFVNYDTGNICDDDMIVREFVLYDRRGNRDHFKCRLYDYFRTEGIDEESNNIKIAESDSENIEFSNKIIALVRSESINLEGNNPIDYEIVTASMKDSILRLESRGLYATDIFDDEELSDEDSKIFVYLLNYHQETSEFIIYDSKNGEIDNTNYPKFGNIIFRSS